LGLFSHTDSHTGIWSGDEILLPHPPHHQLHHKPDFIFSKRPPLFNPMPFSQTSPAAGGGRVLC